MLFSASNYLVVLIIGYNSDSENLFRTLKGMNILWVILWIVLVYDSPETHPFINENEKGYIVTTRVSKKPSQDAETVPPYFKIFTSG